MDTRESRDRCSCGRELYDNETHCPKCGQKRIDFSARGQQLRLLREWKVAGSYPAYDGRTVSGAIVKTVLRAIDDIVGAENFKRRSRGEATTQALAIRRQDLIDQTGYSLQTIRRAVGVLADHLSILDKEDTRIGESPGHVLMIDWALFAELVSAGAPPAVLRDRAVSKTRSQVISTGPQTDCELPTGALHLPTGDFHRPTVGRSPLCAVNARTHTPSPQRETSQDEGGGEDVSVLIQRAADAGLFAARSLVLAAVERCGAAHVTEILDHFDRTRHSAGWDALRLGSRLKEADPAVAPSSGWGPPAKPGAASTRDEFAELDALHGARLDRMPAHLVVTFGERVLRREPGPLAMLRNFGGEAKYERAVRLPLLRALNDGQEP